MKHVITEQTEPVALAIRDHQSALRDWQYGRLSTELHRWVEIFDLEFKLRLPSYPVTMFAPLRNAYASYYASRSEVGTRDNITFNTNELTRDPALILRTMCHELIHLWQHYLGTPSPRNYHNEEFRRKAFACGLIVSPEGCTCGHTQVFTDVLLKYGIQLEPLAAEIRLWGAAKRDIKMKKWRCGPYHMTVHTFGKISFP